MFNNLSKISKMDDRSIPDYLRNNWISYNFTLIFVHKYIGIPEDKTDINVTATTRILHGL